MSNKEDFPGDFQDDTPHLTFGKFLSDGLNYPHAKLPVDYQIASDAVVAQQHPVQAPVGLSPRTINRIVKREKNILNDTQYVEGRWILWAFFDDTEN